MKKFIAFLGSLLIIALILSCCSIDSASADDKYGVDIDRVDRGGWGSAHYEIFVDRETKVMYLRVGGEESCGLCPLYNADGSLRLYQGE